jgi:hypothetical protein
MKFAVPDINAVDNASIVTFFMSILFVQKIIAL